MAGTPASSMNLVVEDDQGRKTVFPLSSEGPAKALTIGRHATNQVLLAERNVSRRHAKLWRQNGSLLVEDLGSANGVRVNGDRIQGQFEVREGDRIQIGDYGLAIEREVGANALDRTTEPELAALPTDAERKGRSAADSAGLPAPTLAPLPRPAADSSPDSPPESVGLQDSLRVAEGRGQTQRDQRAANGRGEPAAERAASAVAAPPPDAGNGQPDSPADPVGASTDETAEALPPLHFGRGEGPNADAAAAPSDRRWSQEPTAVIRISAGAPEGRRLAEEPLPLAAAEQPRLIVLNTSEAGRELPLVATSAILGRAPRAGGLVIGHRSVSKAHARISRGPDGRWRIFDLGSRNGVKVNGDGYGEAAVNDGDLLRLGHVELRFVAAGQHFDFVRRGADATRPRRWLVGALGLGALLLLALLIWRSGWRGDQSRLAQGPRVAPTVAVTPAPVATPTSAPAVPAAPAATADARPRADGPASPEAAGAAPTAARPAVAAPAASAAAFDAASSEPLRAARALARARKWDRAAEKLQEVAALAPEDGAVLKLRREIEAGREREAAKAAIRSDRRRRTASTAPGGSPSVSAMPAEAADDGPEADPAGGAAPARGERYQKAQEAYADAIGAIGAADYVGAIAKLERSLALDPSLADAHKGLGICYAHLREPGKGAFHYEQYLKLKPQARDAADVKKMLADYYKSRGSE